MRVLLIALLAAISYAQTVSVGMVLRPKQIQRRFLTGEQPAPPVPHNRDLPVRTRIWEPRDSEDYVDDSEEYYDQAIVALISVCTASTICCLMMLCMYISHLQHADDIDTTGKPRKRVCCCCIIKQKKPKAIYGTVDNSFPTDFIDVKVPEDFDSPQSRHIIVENEVDWHSRDSDEENDNYVIDDAEYSPNYRGHPGRPNKYQPRTDQDYGGRVPYIATDTDSAGSTPYNTINVGGSSMVTDSENISVGLDDLHQQQIQPKRSPETAPNRRVSFRDPVADTDKANLI